MIASDVFCSDALFVALIKARIKNTALSMVRASLNTRIRDVGKVDTLKVAKRSRDTQEMSDDRLTKASLRKAKRKERQSGKKQIKQELKD